ncbi:hypothetical protein KC19_4G135200 [Ceratodon purpureus]|uniref:Protein kinase domain-containing protein n=1 Tax=Ceratodon purpureus TaxID=3225 RepID=A0A8T0I8K2_CERPU|nr:hypothetical protein KC19_4G135200 [Ceratodon purpureus]
MTTEERPWARRAPPDASAGYNIFTGQRVPSENNEGTSGGSSQASNMQGVVHGDGNGDRMWSNRFSSADFNMFNNIRNSMSTDGYTSFGAPMNLDGPSVSNRLGSTDFNMYNNIRNSIGADGYTTFGAPMNQDGLNVPMDGVSGNRQIFGKPPLDPLLIPRFQPSPASSQANSLIFEGGVPLSARRGSPLRTSSNSQTPTTSSMTPTASGSPSLFARRRASAPVPVQPSNLSRTGGLQPRVPSSPNTSPWHGRSSSDSITMTPMIPRTPSPSDQHVNGSFGYYTLGTPFQAPTWSVGSSNGASLDNSAPRSASYGYNSFGIDSGQLLQSIHALPNRRHTFPVEFAGTSDMMRDLSAMNRSRSVPASPAMQWSSGTGFGRMEHSAPPFGAFGPFGTSYSRGGNYVGDAGNFETAPTGISGIGLLEDAIREQHFERVIALLEQGFSPNGERGSSKTPPLLFAVSTGNERLVKLLLDAGANVNGCDSRQYTALHYAAASGYRGIVNILLAGGANIYAKTDGDLLPVQLAIDASIYEYLSARMKLDMEGRMSPRQAKFASPGSLNFSSFQRPASADQDQWTEHGALGVAANKGGGYQDRELRSPVQGFGEGTHMQPGIGGIQRQSSLDSASQAVGSRLKDWETFRNSASNSASEPVHQVSIHRAFISQRPNVVSNEWSNSEFNQGMDVLMQDGTGYSKGSFTRPLSEQVLQEIPPLQRSSSAPVESWHKSDAFQSDVLPQSSDPVEQKNSSTNMVLLPVVPNSPSGVEQKALDDQKSGLKTTNSLLQVTSTEAQGAAHEAKTGTDSSDTNHPQETEVSKITDDNEELESEGVNVRERTAEMRKRFARACDSMAPSMMEKFRAATTSGRSLELHEIEEMLGEKASGTPQAPETPRQVGESQEKSDTRAMDSSQGSSSSSQKGKADSVDVPPASALKGDARKMKEKKKTVTFALADSPSEEDLALIREDWHEAARSGCVGCGKPGCEGQCLAPEKLPSISASDVASCSSSSKTASEELFTAPKPVRTGTVRWTRGELLGEGAYGKVFAGLNQDTGELMAVKQLKLDTAAEGQERQFYLAALEREIAFYKTMRHKHIVGYIDMEQDLETGSLYVFLEYVSGGSIQSMLERFGRFSEPLVRVYTRQLLLGLEYLHGKKIVHRDIKGGNVLVDADGVIKLADFGASKAFHDPTQTDGFKSIRGSVFWMAPEVIKGDGYGRRADIWSVGCTVVEMLTAVHPWPGMDNTWTAIFHIAKASSGPPIPEGISEVIEDFLSRCFQLDPKKRPTSTEVSSIILLYLCCFCLITLLYDRYGTVRWFQNPKITYNTACLDTTLATFNSKQLFLI